MTNRDRFWDNKIYTEKISSSNYDNILCMNTSTKIFISGALLLSGYLYFNRNPVRVIPYGETVVSPADGTITSINDNKIDIFIGLFDVHYQRSPYCGIIIESESTSSYNRLKMESDIGFIIVERWGGLLAKSVSTFVNIWSEVSKGQIIGRILLGSHASITLPQRVIISAKVGDHVIAGETIIAYL